MNTFLLLLLLFFATRAEAEYIVCEGLSACMSKEHTCDNDGHDCTLMCSGDNSCRGMTIYGPRAPHKLHVICTVGSTTPHGGLFVENPTNTCELNVVHGEASGGVRFSCGITRARFTGRNDIKRTPRGRKKRGRVYKLSLIHI